MNSIQRIQRSFTRYLLSLVLVMSIMVVMVSALNNENMAMQLSAFLRWIVDKGAERSYR